MFILKGFPDSRILAEVLFSPKIMSWTLKSKG